MIMNAIALFTIANAISPSINTGSNAIPIYENSSKQELGEASKWQDEMESEDIFKIASLVMNQDAIRISSQVTDDDFSLCPDRTGWIHSVTYSDNLDELVVHIDSKERDATLTDAAFKSGGVNKKVDRTTGTLRADTKIGREDFERETALAAYSEGKPELIFFTSYQRKIDAPKRVDKKYTYAEFDIFEKNAVSSEELLDIVYFLDRESDDALNIALQLIEAAKVMYQSELAHRDLHMGNLIVHKINETDELFLKVIDFGRVKYDSDFDSYQYNDIHYLFDREGESFLETFVRNYIVALGSYFFDDLEIAQKHYPIHKLIDPFGDHKKVVRNSLSKIGQKLESDLSKAKNEQEQDTAFMHAKCSVSQLFDQFNQQDSF